MSKQDAGFRRRLQHLPHLMHQLQAGSDEQENERNTDTTVYEENVRLREFFHLAVRFSMDLQGFSVWLRLPPFETYAELLSLSSECLRH